jgi:hypothetical protein
MDMTTPGFPVHDGHVRLLAGASSSGEPVYEVVPAAMVGPHVYDVLGSPALASGCAAGDRIRVSPDGRFEVLTRGGNLCLVAVPRTPVDNAAVAALRSAFLKLDGATEMPADGRFIVITVPVVAGFAVVEEIANTWASRNDADWYFGNVDDEDDRPLGWWTDTVSSSDDR